MMYLIRLKRKEVLKGLLISKTSSSKECTR